MKEEFTTNTRRWYDKDPVLSSAMKTLEESDDETHKRRYSPFSCRHKGEKRESDPSASVLHSQRDRLIR